MKGGGTEGDNFLLNKARVEKLLLRQYLKGHFSDKNDRKTQNIYRQLRNITQPLREAKHNWPYSSKARLRGRGRQPCPAFVEEHKTGAVLGCHSSQGRGRKSCPQVQTGTRSSMLLRAALHRFPCAERGSTEAQHGVLLLSNQHTAITSLHPFRTAQRA